MNLEVHEAVELFAVFFFLICFFCVLFPIRTVIRQKKLFENKVWEAVPAEIKSSCVESQMLINSRVYWPRIEYNYEFKGHSYSSSILTPDSNGAKTSDRRWAEKWVAILPEGTKVTAFVDVNNPKVAVLYPESPSGWFHLLSLGFAAFGLFSVILLFIVISIDFEGKLNTVLTKIQSVRFLENDSSSFESQTPHNEMIRLNGNRQVLYNPQPIDVKKNMQSFKRKNTGESSSVNLQDADKDIQSLDIDVNNRKEIKEHFTVFPNQNIVVDERTGLMWMRHDFTSVEGRPITSWKEALNWSQKINSQNYGGYDDWYLPSIKEYRGINKSSNDRRLYHKVFYENGVYAYASSNMISQSVYSYISFNNGFATSGSFDRHKQNVRFSARLVRRIK